jgi:hypothetical protein
VQARVVSVQARVVSVQARIDSVQARVECEARVVSVQARVVRRGRVFRDYGLLPGRLPGARGYPGGEDFTRLADLKAKCKREWTCDTVLRDYDSVRSNTGDAIGNWWSGGKS